MPNTLRALPPVITVGGRVLASTQVVTPLTIKVGRSDPGEQPEANACGFALLGELPQEVALYAEVTVALAHGEGGTWDDTWVDLWSDPWVMDPEEDPTAFIPRFRGRITDLAPVGNGGLLITQVQAVGMKAELGRVIVGGETWWAESEDERLQRIAEEVTPDGIDVGGVGADWELAQRAAKRFTALEAIHHTAAAGAIVHETAEGQVVFEPWDYRAGVDSTLVLSGTDIEDGVAWAQRIDRYVKQVVVRYGAAAESNSEQPEVKVGARGRFQPSTTITTTLKDEADAELFGRLVLARWGSLDQWDAPILSLPVSLVDDDQWQAIQGLSVSQVITTDGVSELPTPLPHGNAEWFVEGWLEEWDRKGNGPIWQTVNVAVSSRQRFRPDQGESTEVVELLVKPSQAVYGTSRQVTGRVATQLNGVPVESGQVLLSDDLNELAVVDVGAGGAFSFTLAGDDLPPGEHRLQVTYLGVALEYLPSEPATTPAFLVEEPPSLVATCSLSLSPSRTVNQGNNVLLTAAIGVTQGKSRVGKVTWQIRRDGGAWSDLGSKSTQVNTKSVSLTWASTQSAKTAEFRAIFDPWLAGVSNATSGIKSVDVLGKTTKTKTYSPSWSATYDGDGTRDTGAGDLLFQGYISDAHGNQDGLVGGFGVGSDWKGWSISKVEVRLTFPGWQLSAGTARIGSHQHSSRPNSNPKTNAGRSTVKSWKRGATKWVDVTSWGKGLATGNLAGICVGPGSDRSKTFSGYAEGASAGGAVKPQLKITGYRWS